MSSEMVLTDDHVNGVSLRSSLAGLWRAYLAPLRQRPAKSIRFIVLQYGDKCFWLIMQDKSHVDDSSWGAQSASDWHY